MLLIDRERLYRQSKIAELRIFTKPILEIDIARIWLSFYESYLFIHETSKLMPTNDEFVKFRGDFLDIFRASIGPVQMSYYEEIYGGRKYFNMYMMNEFERLFKSVFMKKINEILLNKEDTK